MTAPTEPTTPRLLGRRQGDAVALAVLIEATINAYAGQHDTTTQQVRGALQNVADAFGEEAAE